MGALRAAIVGLGPKGLFALERLLDHAQRSDPPPRLQIDVFEPHPVPGAGPVYDPGQPEYLRMNFAADGLDMWCDGGGALPAAQRLGFVDWRRERGDRDAERYPPRAQVGRYLADGLARLRRHAPAGATITLRPAAVRAVRRHESSWTVVAADRATYEYDEVLVAVGHRTGPTALADSWTHAAPLIDAVFPVDRRLSREHVAPGAVVAVRGFALTFLDAAIALTQGRGGRFEADDHPYRLRYVPSSADAGLIAPFSRTGRPMLAKPGPELAAAIPDLAWIAQSGRAQILALAEDFDPQDDLVAILAATVGACLLAAGDGSSRVELERAARQWLLGACRGAPPAAAQDPAGEVEQSLAVGAGLLAPDLPWALGHSWRSLYPALVARLSGGGTPARAWPAFSRLAAQMERVAFGPPAVNAAKLLALIGARRVDLTHVAGAQITTRDGITSIGSGHGARAVDVVVDAVLPGPGALSPDDGLLDGLIAGGHARVMRGRRGLEVCADCTCVGRDGDRTPGLAAIGRPTEDCVIGNDTLSRTLHPQADRWGRRVARRAIESDMVASPREAA